MKNIFFKTILSLLLLLVASFSFAQKSPITFNKPTQKFKKVNEGQAIELVYKFSNYGKHALNVLPPKVDCSCTEVIIPENTIASGGTDSIIVRFDTKDKIGWQQRDLSIQFTAPLLKEPIENKITFKGMVKASKTTKAAYKANKKKR